MTGRAAAPWDMAQWFNADDPVNLVDLKGRVVLAAAFQMACRGCVEHTLPQMQRAHVYFPRAEVAVVGLHTVFENHDAQAPQALAAFLTQSRINFPIGVDRPSADHPIPVTMRRYGLQGTPTLLLIDRQGRLRRQTFGHIPDLQLGAEIMSLMREDRVLD